MKFRVDQQGDANSHMSILITSKALIPFEVIFEHLV